MHAEGWRRSFWFLVACCVAVALVSSCNDANDEDDDRQSPVVLPQEAAFYTGLPVLIIETPDSQPVNSKTEWVANARMTLLSATGEQRMTASIRGRGNVTWKRYPKKPYSLKLSKKAELLGMKAAKRWVLLANWADRTLLRNDVAFEMARRTLLEWTPHGEPVELVLNGVYRGSYYLCEKIQIHSSRLDIPELDEADDADSITGSFLMELDEYFDEVNKFRSAVYALPYEFRNPDAETLTSSQFAYMEQYVKGLELSLADDHALQRGDYKAWLDPLTFVDWWVVNELCYNKETGKPRSVYVYKPRGKTMKAGPVWDYDFSTFTLHEDVYVAKNFPYLRCLFRSPDFQQLAKQRWTELRPVMEGMSDYIDQRASLIRLSAAQNTLLWPITSKGNGDEQLTFDEAVERMKSSLTLRMAVIDRFLAKF